MERGTTSGMYVRTEKVDNLVKIHIGYITVENEAYYDRSSRTFCIDLTTEDEREDARKSFMDSVDTLHSLVCDKVLDVVITDEYSYDERKMIPDLRDDSLRCKGRIVEFTPYEIDCTESEEGYGDFGYILAGLILGLKLEGLSYSQNLFVDYVLNNKFSDYDDVLLLSTTCEDTFKDFDINL